MWAKSGDRRTFLFSTTGLVAILSATAFSASAQEQSINPEAGSVDLKTITILQTTKSPTSTPAPVDVVNHDTINRVGAVKLDDVLRGTPGVFTAINESNPGIAVNIRGFEGSGRVKMMVDGVPQNYRNSDHGSAGYTYVDPNLLSQIDIQRGAETTTNGGAHAGSVNFRTLGVDDILLEGKNTGVLGRASWGSNGTGFSEMLAGATRMNSVGIAAAISRRDSKNFKNGDGVTVEKTGQELTSGLFKAEFGFGEDHNLTLGGVLYNNHYGTYQAGFRAPVLYDMFLQNRTVFAQYNYNPTGNDLINLDVNAYYNATLQNWTGGNGSAVGRQVKTETPGVNAANRSRFNLGEVNVSWVNGLEYAHDKAGGNEVGVNPVDANSNKFSAFSEATWNYKDFELITGLRYDYFKLENEDGTITNSDSELSPKITLAYNVTNWLQPYVTYAHSMRTPTLQESFLGGVAHAGAGTMHGNPDLRPEKQRGWEFGLNVAKDGIFTTEDSLRIKANYYTMRVEDYITLARDYSSFANIEGTSKVSGFELDARYDAGVVFAALAYTHAKSELPEQNYLGGNQYLPENIVTFTGGGRFFERKLEAGARVHHVSSGKTLDGDKSEAYTLVDLFAKYKFTENADLSFQVLNVADKNYTPALSIYGGGRGRTFLVATQFQF
ncbi:TonB-dependent receptor domain-containing protein [Falsochrobactrum ovis]|uniref:Heme transporter BhuA n=1 Tax=Falsochrobactrum ovis TaxID=1293442 RepID=A0A364JRF8_9HYPH|nr:TonB-dependent receptor [Falsochrobactrum ovis]RAK24682.1 hemoglobin/transferrin/lactoferrin receptor protein [Falsochrobactrum ovis]